MKPKTTQDVHTSAKRESKLAFGASFINTETKQDGTRRMNTSTTYWRKEGGNAELRGCVKLESVIAKLQHGQFAPTRTLQVTMQATRPTFFSFRLQAKSKTVWAWLDLRLLSSQQTCAAITAASTVFLATTSARKNKTNWVQERAFGVAR